jgi:feruloyl esterase
MEEAEFYPGDYDGVVAGAPGMSYTHLMLSFLWGLKAAERPGGFLPPQTLAVLHKAVLDACDADDGARDGLIGDPPACRFDPGKLLCKAGDEAGCLTPTQVETARLIYQGPRNARTGAALYPGFAFGSEADPAASKAEALFYGWTAIQGPLARMFAIPLLQEMVYKDPKWDWRSFDWDSDVADLDRRISADITATDPDLRAFARRGGKLIMYQGWGDPLNGQTLPIQYRDAVIEVFSTGGAPRAATRTVDGFFRVFMAPGMGHCAGGPGPSQFDALTAVRAWVETGRAPRVLIAVRAPRTGLPDPGPPPMSRPLCPFPGVARWRGTGDVNAAETWRCVVSR